MIIRIFNIVMKKFCLSLFFWDSAYTSNALLRVLFGTVSIPTPSPGYRSWCGYPGAGNGAFFLTVKSCFYILRTAHSLFITL